MYCLAHVIPVFRTVELGNDYCGAGGKTGEETHQKIDQGGGGAAYRGERLLAYKVSHHYGVCRIIKLLKKGTEQDREEEDQKLLPDNSFRDLIDIHFFPGFHDVVRLSVFHKWLLRMTSRNRNSGMNASIIREDREKLKGDKGLSERFPSDFCTDSYPDTGLQVCGQIDSRTIP